jgi:hypothetical protein
VTRLGGPERKTFVEGEIAKWAPIKAAGQCAD